MRYTFTGKNMTVPDYLKEKAEQKINRLQRLMPVDDVEVSITFSKVRHQHKMEVNIPLHRRVLRAEVTTNDVNSCVDAVVDVLERQVIKYKGRLRERSRRNAATKEEISYISASQDEPDDSAPKIHRTKRFALKPMETEDAIMELEMLGHSFYVFHNASTDEVNVVYKRNDGDYGLIEPQI